jgi:hypothetical protein
MVLYLHSIYHGGNKYFSLDYWDKEDKCFHTVMDCIGGVMPMKTLYGIARILGARKVVLDI